MSAQIITALRERAAILTEEADSLTAAGISQRPDQGSDHHRNVNTLRMLAFEFSELADQAEAP